MPNELTLSERAALELYYDAAHNELDRLARQLVSEQIENFDALPTQEQEGLLVRARQDIAIANVELGHFMSYLGIKAKEAAVLSLDANVLQELTEDEQSAVIQEQELRVLAATELEVNLVTGSLLEEIDALGAYAYHPSGYSSLNEMAEAAGISASERSDLMALSTIIFPYLENTLNIDPRDLWVRIGKAKFRRIVPLLRTLIDPAYDGTQRVRSRIDLVRNMVAESQGVTPERVSSNDIAHRVLSIAEDNTARELDATLRGDERTPFVIRGTQTGETIEITARITQDDLTLMRRRLDTYADFVIDREPIFDYQQATPTATAL